ncbi:MAG: PhzF family phenazine biosynthesis protein [Deltaproteobacteria bacterium]|jgi:predicted PhzF superfamily epimerase YddE/YHI9|nr:PhzF family phenazine biosynthesis protein [Deltaproteobacteria bacterium]
MIRKIFLVDALVDGPFSGAPTTVVFLESPMDKFKMLSLANEMGTGETVYVLLHYQAAYLLRFFGRTQELPLGAHGCHAAAHLIFELGLLPPDEPIVFLTQEGEIHARRAASERTEIKFSAQPMNKMDQANQNLYAEVLSVNPSAITWAGLTPARAAIVAIDAPAQLRRLAPDRDKLIKTGAATLAVTAPDPSGADYCLRSFTPSPLLPERQASANIHRALAPKWAQILQKKSLVARQYSNRGGLVRLDVSDPNSVVMTAQSRTVLRGDLVIGLQDSLGPLPR